MYHDNYSELDNKQAAAKAEYFKRCATLFHIVKGATTNGIQNRTFWGSHFHSVRERLNNGGIK
jgi:hypothetical protein